MGHWMITIAALAAAPGCRRGGLPPDDGNHDGGGGKNPQNPPPDAASNGGGPRKPDPLTVPSLAECLKVDRPTDKEVSDPHGQGSDLLGLGFEVSGKIFVRVDQFDATTFKNAAGGAIEGIRIVSHHLEGHNAQNSSPLTDPDWTNAVVMGQVHCPNPKFAQKTYPVKLHILGLNTNFALMSAQGQGLWKAYRLQLELEGGKMLNACHDANDVAFPIAGYWDDSSVHNITNNNIFSFACTKRDAAFCITTGYHDDQGDNQAQLFEACTRMMRADYCGDGRSYTKDGTFISTWDNKGIAEEPSIPQLVFEAAWNRKGVVCWARPRWKPGNGVAKPPCLTDRNQCPTPPTADPSGPPILLNKSCVMHLCTVSWTEGQQDILSGLERIGSSH
jgi:hypothetical protein